MNRNFLNLVFALGALVLVAGCFCRSDRDSDVGPDQSNRPASNPASQGPASNKSATTASKDKKADEGDFLVELLPVSTPRYVELDKQVRDEKLLEDAAADLNRAL